MPGVGGVRRIKIQCCDVVPLEWLLGRANAVTLWRSVYLRNRFCPLGPCDRRRVALLVHELVHVEQFRNSPVLFPLKYLFNLILHGYWNNPAEIEARVRARNLIESYSLEDPCHCAEVDTIPVTEIIEIVMRGFSA